MSHFDLAEASRACIRCAACLPVCPTWRLSRREEEGPRGRIAAARGWAEGHLALTDDLVAHQQSCLLCDACTAACPAGVEMEPIGLALRAAIADRTPPDRGVRAGLALLERPRALRLALGAGRRLAPLAGLAGLAASAALMPASHGSVFRADGRVYPAHGPRRARVAFLTGCLMAVSYGDVHRAAIRLLQRGGSEVVVPAGQTCCGALHAHNGLVAQGDALRTSQLALLAGAGVDAIVVDSAGCGNWLAHGASGSRTPPVVDLTSWLDDGPPLPLSAPSLSGIVAVHDACHLAQARRVTAPPRRLVAQVPGVRLVELHGAGACCGSAGIYNLTHPETGAALGAIQADAVERSGAAVVVTTNPGCLNHLTHQLAARGSRTRIVHIASWLAAHLPPDGA